MGGELGIKIASAHLSDDAVRPFGRYDGCSDCGYIDLTMTGKNGEFLHICGENDWGYFALDLLKPILKAANELYLQIKKEIENKKPEAVLVGKNDFRLLDILHIARDGEIGISTILSVPIVKGNFMNGVKLLNDTAKATEEIINW